MDEREKEELGSRDNLFENGKQTDKLNNAENTSDTHDTSKASDSKVSKEAKTSEKPETIEEEKASVKSMATPKPTAKANIKLIVLIAIVALAAIVFVVAMIGVLSGDKFGDIFTPDNSDNSGDDKADSNKNENHVHTFADWEVIKEATCSTKGEEYRRCSCGTIETRKVGKTDDHIIVIDEAKAATCTEEGLTEGKHCSLCDEIILAQETIEKLSHVEVTIPAVEATCSTAGYTEGRSCSLCGEIFVAPIEISPLPHTYDDDYDRLCNICGHRREVNCNHSETRIIPGMEVSCTENGLTDGEICKTCGEILVAQTVIESQGHNIVEDKHIYATCTADGLTAGTHCDRCGEVIVVQEVIPMLGHTEVIDYPRDPTCTREGKTQGSHCSRCRVVFVAQEVVPALGHDEIIDPGIPATCTNGGVSDGITCARCGITISYKQSIPALGHSYTVTVEQKTCMTESSINYTCVCGDSYSELASPIEISFVLSGTSSSVESGYGTYTRSYNISATGGYGIILYKYEIYATAESNSPLDTIDFTQSAHYSLSSVGESFNAGEYVVKITAKDDAGNISVYRFKIADESLIDFDFPVVHPDSDWVVESEPSCQVTGTRSKYCPLCGEKTTTESIQKTSHTLVAESDATFIATHGFGKYICCVCNETLYLDRNSKALILAELVLSADGKTIMSCANANEANLLIIPDTVTGLKDDTMFVYCRKLRFVQIGSGLSDITLQNLPIEQIYLPVGTNVVIYSCAKLKTVIWADGITGIDRYGYKPGCDGAMMWFSGIETLVIPTSVTLIDSNVFKNLGSLATIYYKGTVEQWNSISINTKGNDDFLNATKYYYSESEPIDENYSYWHYVDGVPTPW